MSYVQPAACTFAYTPATGHNERLPSGGGLIASYHTYSNCTWPVTLYEESLISPGRPHEDILFSPAGTEALCVALAGRAPPPRELMHLKLVCRSWRAMIESERFVKLLRASVLTGAKEVLAVLLYPVLYCGMSK